MRHMYMIYLSCPSLQSVFPTPKIKERKKKVGSHSFANLLVAADLFRRLFRRITVSKSVLTTLKLVRSTLRELSN